MIQYICDILRKNQFYFRGECYSQLYPENTVFLTDRGTIGKLSLAGIPLAMNQSCYVLRGRGTDQILIYFYTQQVPKALRNKANCKGWYGLDGR